MAASDSSRAEASTGSNGSSAIRVLPGDVASAIAAHNAQLPFTTLTYAQSLDGSLASPQGAYKNNAASALTSKRGCSLATGEIVALSGEQSMQMTHGLRAIHDAILVGVGTVVADNPRLTTRGIPGGADPLPVVIDPTLRTPLHCKLVSAAAAGRRMLVLAARSALVADPTVAQRQKALEASGVTVLYCPSGTTTTKGHSYRISVADVLGVLSGEGVRSVMVEGGARVIEAFLESSIHDGGSLVHNVVITICPVFVGGVPVLRRGGGASAAPGAAHDGDEKGGAVPRQLFPNLGAPLGGSGDSPVYQQLGGDIIVHGSLVPPAKHA